MLELPKSAPKKGMFGMDRWMVRWGVLNVRPSVLVGFARIKAEVVLLTVWNARIIVGMDGKRMRLLVYWNWCLRRGGELSSRLIGALAIASPLVSISNHTERGDLGINIE
jgi:hypothetical protein